MPSQISKFHEGTTMPARILKAAVDKAPDLMAGISGAAAGVSWLSTVNDVLQLGATAVAIVAGVYAIKWNMLRVKDMKRKLDDVHDVVVPEEVQDEQESDKSN